MINPVESGLDLFSAIVRDMFKTNYNYGIYKNYNMLQESGKNYNNMRTHKIILQGHEQEEFARDESRTVFTVGDEKYYSRSTITEAIRKRKDKSGELTTDTLNLCVQRSSNFIPALWCFTGRGSLQQCPYFVSLSLATVRLLSRSGLHMILR